MKKILGILGLLIFVCLFTSVLSHDFVGAFNMYNITRWSALFGILSIGVALVIITGGIDLSIGSVVGLIGCLLPWLLTRHEWSVPAAITACLSTSLLIGLVHGLLITQLSLQPFVVTLCGLLFYRGFSRWFTGDQTQGFGQAYDNSLRLLATGKPCSVATLIMIFGVAMALWAIVEALRGADRSTARRWLAVMGMLGGISLALIGGSRFSAGYEPQPGNVVFTAAGYQVRALEVNVPSEGAERSERLMKWIGLPVFTLASLVFLARALRVRPMKMLPPLVTLLGVSLLFALAVWKIAPIYEQYRPDEVLRVSGVTMTGATLRWIVLLVVFLIVGLFMGSVAWAVNAAISTDDTFVAGLLPLVLASGIVGLLGLTPLAQTKVPMPMLIMMVLAGLAGVFLNRTIYGRYLLALGRNEEAARYSGINTHRMIIVAYMICSLLAGLGGILFALDINSIQPSGHGNFYELYAIAAAVLGGCSLRGGEGSILGVVIGAAVMRVLYNSINILGIPTQLEFAIIGLVILAGAIVDVVVKRVVARRRALQQARQADAPDVRSEAKVLQF
jgi:ribose/xylose/arabinose/galactoside ABC-type transport system permease subunit